jgi:hypothetical protein
LPSLLKWNSTAANVSGARHFCGDSVGRLPIASGGNDVNFVSSSPAAIMGRPLCGLA